MDAAARDAFLRQPLTAVIATVDAQGRAHAVPVWYLWDGEAFEIVTGRDSAKLRHIRRSGRASLCVDVREGRFVSVTAEGPVTVRDAVTRDERYALHERYTGAERAQKTVEANDAHESMVMLRLAPERWLGYGA